jgi:hypothetical protein
MIPVAQSTALRDQQQQQPQQPQHLQQKLRNNNNNNDNNNNNNNNNKINNDNNNGSNNSKFNTNNNGNINDNNNGNNNDNGTEKSHSPSLASSSRLQSSREIIKPTGPVIITSRLSKKHVAFCYTTCRLLGRGKIVTSDTKDTTHLVLLAGENNSLTSEAYTFKYLSALTSGLWIVTIKWVVDSAHASRFLPEEAYEAKGDPDPLNNHVDTPRRFRTSSPTERYILGDYRVYIVGTFQQSQVTREQLTTLMRRCGTEVVTTISELFYDSTRSHRVLLTDDLDELSDDDIELCNTTCVRPIHPDWVIESILSFRAVDTNNYMLGSDDEDEDDDETETVVT